MKNIKFLFGLFIYKFSFIKKNRIVFTSFNGHYSDSPKAISEKMHIYGDYEIIWLLSNDYDKSIPSYVKTCKINSLKSFWFLGTASILIDNVYGFRAFFINESNKNQKIKHFFMKFFLSKKNQPIYTTTHGTPLKRIGKDQINNCVLDIHAPNTFLLVGDELTKNVLERVTFNKIPVTVLGSPRTDVLFLPKEDLLGYENKKIIMYAPTFRNDGIDVSNKNLMRSGIMQLDMMDFDTLFQTLSNRFSGEWIMILRFHYHVAQLIDWNALEKKYPGKFINGNLYDDMAYYLSKTDVLLTDSSSSMFDFALTGRPCFLFFPDYFNYKNNERGFYLDVEKMPFPLCETFEMLIDAITEFNFDEYKKNIDSLNSTIKTKSDGKSTDRIIKYIFKDSLRR